MISLREQSGTEAEAYLVMCGEFIETPKTKSSFFFSSKSILLPNWFMAQTY